MEMELGKESLSDYAMRLRQEKKPVSENQAALIMQGVFSALFYMHDEKNVIHRDLKPENILIGDYKDLTQVKVIDFGLAIKFTKENVMDFAKCGTLLYTPPE